MCDGNISPIHIMISATLATRLAAHFNFSFLKKFFFIPVTDESWNKVRLLFGNAKQILTGIFSFLHIQSLYFSQMFSIPKNFLQNFLEHSKIDLNEKKIMKMKTNPLLINPRKISTYCRWKKFVKSWRFLALHWKYNSIMG